MIERVELPSWFCKAQTNPVVGSIFSPSTEPAIEYCDWTTPFAALYCTMVLLPPARVESALLPYSPQTEPLPIVIESGAVPLTAAPLAKTETPVTTDRRKPASRT